MTSAKLAPPSQRGTVAALLSPEADAAGSGVFRTSPGLVRRAAVGPWAEGLSQYLAIRLGDAGRGRRAFAALLRMTRSLPPEELVVPPGPKAQLYRLARQIASGAAAPSARRPSPDASIAEVARPLGLREDGGLPWREEGGKRGKVLAALRAALDERDAELLELRHARELSVREIACVLERSEDEVELELDTAEARARKALGDQAPDPVSARATLYVSAFALARSWQDREGLPADLELDQEEEKDGLAPGTLIGGRYRLIERVGLGAFGHVYRAEDVEIPGHQVALKMLRHPSLSEAARHSALRELELNAAVFHPSLVQFKDHGWFEQRLWFVMPWYEGETLHDRMRRGALSRAEARRIFEPLARALAALHEAGIRHQDIKPENVLLTRLPGYGLEDEILPVLIDLGVAAEEQETLLGGTPLYFAPEVARRFVGGGGRDREVDRSADVFALALSLRNALEPGTQEDVPAGAIQAFVERRAHEIPPMPEGRDLRYLEPCFERWLSLDPSERPSAEQLAEELTILTAPEERRERRLRVARWLVPLLMTLAAAFSLVVYALAERAEREEREARRARSEAADVRADLIVENARRAALEEGHAALLGRYEQSRLTRSELAGQLATADRQLGIVRGELEGALRDRAALRDRLNDARASLASTEGALSTERAALTEARARVESLRRALAEEERRASALGAELARAQSERDTARRQLTTATQELAAARTGEQRERDRADAVAAELEGARAREAHAEAELARLRVRIASLAAVEPVPTEVVEPEPPAPSSTTP